MIRKIWLATQPGSVDKRSLWLELLSNTLHITNHSWINAKIAIKLL